MSACFKVCSRAENQLQRDRLNGLSADGYSTGRELVQNLYARGVCICSQNVSGVLSKDLYVAHLSIECFSVASRAAFAGFGHR